MKIVLLVDRRWGAGPNDFNLAGDVVDVDDTAAAQLAADGQALSAQSIEAEAVKAGATAAVAALNEAAAAVSEKTP